MTTLSFACHQYLKYTTQSLAIVHQIQTRLSPDEERRKVSPLDDLYLVRLSATWHTLNHRLPLLSSFRPHVWFSGFFWPRKLEQARFVFYILTSWTFFCNWSRSPIVMEVFISWYCSRYFSWTHGRDKMFAWLVWNQVNWSKPLMPVFGEQSFSSVIGRRSTVWKCLFVVITTSVIAAKIAATVTNQQQQQQSAGSNLVATV